MNVLTDLEQCGIKMWAKPTKADLATMPGLHTTKGDKDTLVRGHFFLGSCDWFVTEYDPEDKIFFGFAILNADYEMAEWGNISLTELESLKVGGFMEVDYDKHWEKKPVKDVEKIVQGGGVYEN